MNTTDGPVGVLLVNDGESVGCVSPRAKARVRIAVAGGADIRDLVREKDVPVHITAARRIAAIGYVGVPGPIGMEELSGRKGP
jgi:hypothetical protein